MAKRDYKAILEKWLHKEGMLGSCWQRCKVHFVPKSCSLRTYPLPKNRW
jgi:hypothetical protein